MTPTEIARVAAGLTRVQREAVKNACWYEERQEWEAFAMYPANINLRDKGLTVGIFGKLTELGIAVRDHILREKSGG